MSRPFYTPAQEVALPLPRTDGTSRPMLLKLSGLLHMLRSAEMARESEFVKHLAAIDQLQKDTNPFYDLMLEVEPAWQLPKKVQQLRGAVVFLYGCTTSLGHANDGDTTNDDIHEIMGSPPDDIWDTLWATGDNWLKGVQLTSEVHGKIKELVHAEYDLSKAKGVDMTSKSLANRMEDHWFPMYMSRPQQLVETVFEPFADIVSFTDMYVISEATTHEEKECMRLWRRFCFRMWVELADMAFCKDILIKEKPDAEGVADMVNIHIGGGFFGTYRRFAKEMEHPSLEDLPVRLSEPVTT